MTWRGTGAVLAGFLAVFVLSLGTDQVLHVLKVYPPWGQAMSDALFLVATAYRVVYGVVGGYITARLAPPDRPMKHAAALGILGLVVGTLGVVATLSKGPALGPLWYPIVIALAALPCSLLGGVVHSRRIR
jgi:hypothetical protein